MFGTDRPRVVSRSVVRSDPERDAWLRVDAGDVLGYVPEHTGRLDERCSNVSSGEGRSVTQLEDCRSINAGFVLPHRMPHEGMR